ncbi:MAG: hypothetical protein ACJ74O_13280 [Frankiaceae bacterium]
MTGWLPRGLVAIAVGAVLAFAVTVRITELDIQSTGAIIMFAGIGYLLVHLGLLGWERGWGSGGAPAAPARVQRPPVHPYEDRENDDRERYRRLQQDWTARGDAERTRVMPTVRDADDPRDY